jgi:Predicted Zn peptidase
MNLKLRVKNLVNKHGTADPFIIASGLGIKTHLAPLPKTVRGFLARVLRRKFIFVNEDLPELSQKIVVCHELGHARLHTGYGYRFHHDTTYYVPSKREREANGIRGAPFGA